MADEEKEVVEEKKGGSPLLLIVIAVVLLLILGAGGFLVLSSKGKNADKENAAKKKKEEEIVYYNIDDAVVVNLACSSGRRFVKATVSLAVSPKKASDELAKKNTEVLDIIEGVLMEISVEDLDTMTPKQIRDRAKKKIKDRLNKILESGEVKDVYFPTFVFQ